MSLAPRSTAPCRVLAVQLALHAILAVVSPPAHARVIDVGPTGAVKTIDAALARAGVGDEIVLERGVEHATAGLRITTDAIEIRSADGPEPPAVIRNTSLEKWGVTIDHRAEGLMLKDVVLTGGPNVTCVRARGRRLTIDNAPPAGEVWRWVQIFGGSQTTILNTDVPAITSYSICSFDADARGLIVSRCTFAGASTESHTIRLQRVYDARLRECAIRGNGARTALSVRDGAGNRVEDCTIDGTVVIGPLADGDGGIKLPSATPEQRMKRDAELGRSGRNYTFKDCTITTGGITVEMGVENLTFDGCRINTRRDWALRLNKDEYAPWRCVPSGKVVNCELTGPAGLRVFDRDRPGFHVFATTANGERVPDSAPPTTAPTTAPTPSPATPGTAPAATQPAVLRFDLIDAASGAVLHELTDGAELPAALPDPLNVLVTTEPARVGSVVVSLNGASRVERTAPYTVGSPALTIPPGENVIEAIPYAADNATGPAGRSAKVTFTRRAAEAPTTQPAPVIPRSEDVLAALAALEVARDRLQASTRPVSP